MKHSVFFLLLLLLGTCSAYENVALRGKATQSIRYKDAFSSASNAIDGNLDSTHHHGSCSSSALQTNPWWRLDLLELYTISYVTITNRGDCCPERINGAEVHIGSSLNDNGITNPLVGVITAIPAGESFTLSFTPVQGRYVTVVLPGKKTHLTLCEVEVHGYRAGEETSNS
ncbi:fucolectin-like [Centropristis striata]|uniref:fucolectin-like n=1 Tax=Centropristis striata TaxID=184440 RepID=UPI0027DEE6F4|nr:fucolectin-like [Centropristis striata]